jgi:hypothetical protein
MRDRLIELIEPYSCGYTSCLKSIADQLLANGWTLPPCYIGQEIWHLTRHYDGRIEIRKGKVSMLQQKADKSWKIRISVRSSVWDFTPCEIGERYFFSREEAEKALKERSEG